MVAREIVGQHHGSGPIWECSVKVARRSPKPPVMVRIRVLPPSSIWISRCHRQSMTWRDDTRAPAPAEVTVWMSRSRRSKPLSVNIAVTHGVARQRHAPELGHARAIGSRSPQSPKSGPTTCAGRRARRRPRVGGRTKDRSPLDVPLNRVNRIPELRSEASLPTRIGRRATSSDEAMVRDHDEDPRGSGFPASRTRISLDEAPSRIALP
jgi:hypothetical protein